MNAPALRDVQRAFHDHLLDRPSDIAAQVVAGGRIGVDHRLHIYHNAYRMRLLECLQENFEKTRSYLGDSAFESSALAFIEETPSQQRNLRWYGDAFPRWLANRFPDDGDIAELAEIDWQLRRAFDGPDADPLQPAALAALAPEDWETVGFRFAPTLCLLPIGYNSVDIWHALDEDRTPPSAVPLPEPAWLLIWRKGWQPHFRTIMAVEHAALSQLLAGSSFSAVCESLGQQYSDDEAAAVAGESLGAWLQDEMIVGLALT
jgi:hypothetical protein